MIQSFLDSLWVILRPRFWLSLDEADHAWDYELNAIIRYVSSIEFRRYTTVINDQEIWTSNYPYAYGNAYTTFGRRSGPPKRRTRYRLKQVIDKHKRIEADRRIRKMRLQSLPGNLEISGQP